MFFMIAGSLNKISQILPVCTVADQGQDGNLYTILHLATTWAIDQAQGSQKIRYEFYVYKRICAVCTGEIRNGPKIEM